MNGVAIMKRLLAYDLLWSALGGSSVGKNAFRAHRPCRSRKTNDEAGNAHQRRPAGGVPDRDR